jgi:hypothetical protein
MAATAGLMQNSRVGELGAVLTLRSFARCAGSCGGCAVISDFWDIRSMKLSIDGRMAHPCQLRDFPIAQALFLRGSHF